MSLLPSTSNFSDDSEEYIFSSKIQLIEIITGKISYGIYAFAVIFSLIQTFWKNRTIDRLLSTITEAYSDRKLESHQVYLSQQIITCYRYDQRFSYIPHPNRAMVFIFAVHVQILMMIAIRTLFSRQTILVKDCTSLKFPLEMLQCENDQLPCPSNATENVVKCVYYSFQMTNLITMSTSVITWHNALRYSVIKLIRFIRWILFHGNDQPRNLCSCFFPATSRRLRCIMYVNYIILWIYLLATAILGLGWNKTLYRITVDEFGSIWTPFVLAADRIYTLNMALIPELLQNSLDTIKHGDELLLVDVETLIHLTSKKTKRLLTTPDN
ncbi:hypothetical protein I4U23_003959 [Adineta vaga]|nr:hypothetical protein I4U23_003959 [Adineta vaga]